MARAGAACLTGVLAGAFFSMPAQAAPAPPSAVGIPHTCDDYYPDAIRKAGIEGNTTLSFTITAEGRVQNPSVAKSSGSTDLDQAALACASRWLYQPATQDGKPVAVTWNAVMQWRVNDPWHGQLTTMPVALGAPHTCASRPERTDAAHGETIVFFEVEPDGTVRHPKVEKSSGNAVLDGYGATCVAKWEFKPAMTGANVPVEVEWYARLKW
jgi:TonB family protein